VHTKQARIPILTRLVAILALLAATVGVGVTVSAVPAFAATTLCSGFTACTTAPYTDHSWAAHYTDTFSGGWGYWSQTAGHNCTNYVAYYEQTVNGQPSTKPSWLGIGNADTWWNYAMGHVAESASPAVGAIAWWGDFTWNGSAGHVGIVERVSNGGATIQVSEDSYPSGPYKWITLNATDANTNSAMGWPQGFIYLGSMGSGGTTTTTLVPGDWLGNHKTDYSVFRPSTGTWYYYNGGGSTSRQYGVSGDVPVPADYNGDGKTDWAVFRPSNGTWYIFPQGGSPYSQSFGLSGDIPVPGDYNGDGVIDRAIFRPSDDTWHYNIGGGDVWVGFGLSGDIPVPAHWDGGSKTEPGVYRPSTGTWYYLTDYGTVSQSFGSTGDIPVPGHYIANSTKPDFAVFRPSTGTWYYLQQGGGSASQSFGLSGDIPVPGDYNGDGKTDLAVFRPSNVTWYYLDGGAVSQSFGSTGDIPAVSTLPLPLLQQYGLV
jgi:hypothetical protein